MGIEMIAIEMHRRTVDRIILDSRCIISDKDFTYETNKLRKERKERSIRKQNEICRNPKEKSTREAK